MRRLLVAVLAVTAIGTGCASTASADPPAETVECFPVAGLAAELGYRYDCVVHHEDGSEEILRT